MPYDDVPTENAPALPVTADEWSFSFSLDKATVDDLDLFSPENSTSNKQMLDFLDKVVTKAQKRGETVYTVIPAKDDEPEQRIQSGVRGKQIPYACLKRLMEGVGAAMKEANDPNG